MDTLASRARGDTNPLHKKDWSHKGQNVLSDEAVRTSQGPWKLLFANFLVELFSVVDKTSNQRW